MKKPVLFALSLFGLSLLASPALGQSPAGANQSPSALPWTAAFVFTLVIMLIVCMPSRKS